MSILPISVLPFLSKITKKQIVNMPVLLVLVITKVYRCNNQQKQAAKASLKIGMSV